MPKLVVALLTWARSAVGSRSETAVGSALAADSEKYTGAVHRNRPTPPGMRKVGALRAYLSRNYTGAVDRERPSCRNSDSCTWELGEVVQRSADE